MGTDNRHGDRGEMRLIDIDDLHIDRKYQRPESSHKSHMVIANSFSWDAFGTVSVKERNGKYYVIDGQQRIAAARICGIKKIPCIVTASDGISDEAAAFVAINTSRKKVTAIEKFVARAKANFEPEASISKWLLLNDFIIKNTNHRDAELGSAPVKCVDRIMRQWKIDEDRAKKSVLLSRAIFESTPIHNHVLTGIFALLGQGIDVGDHLEKIRDRGGARALLRAIQVVQIEASLAEATGWVCAVGILNVINHKRRAKIIISETTQRSGREGAE